MLKLRASGAHAAEYTHYRVNINDSSITHGYRKNLVENLRIRLSYVSNYVNNETRQCLIQRLYIYIFFHSSVILENEWHYSNAKNEMIINLDNIVEYSVIEQALNNISRDKLDDRYKFDYDVLLCENGEQMYRLLKRHPYIGSRMRFRLKRRFGNSKLFKSAFKFRKRLKRLTK